MDAINKIKDNAVYKQVLSDSFGGVMYNVANRDKYDASEVIKLWDNLTPAERGVADGIMTSAINFLKGN